MQAQVVADGGSKEYSDAIAVYLAFLVDRYADFDNSLCRWKSDAECPVQLFARQAIPMVWDFAEVNPFSNSSGSWNSLTNRGNQVLTGGAYNFTRRFQGNVFSQNASANNKLQGIKD